MALSFGVALSISEIGSIKRDAGTSRRKGRREIPETDFRRESSSARRSLETVFVNVERPNL
jgi:hypothetical protein